MVCSLARAPFIRYIEKIQRSVLLLSSDSIHEVELGLAGPCS